MNKLKQLIIVIVLAIIPSILYSQTPYDSYAPSCSKIAMLKLPDIQHRTYNPDTLSQVSYIELNSKSGTLAYYDKQENLLYQATLNPLEQKWWTKDPKMVKYPGMSPYNAFANNPIIYVDPDGKDYSLYINHKERTITVKATYMAVNQESIKPLQEAVIFWNNQSDKFQYVVGEGENKIKYNIKIDLSITDYDDSKTFVNDGPVNYVTGLSEKEYNKSVEGKKGLDDSYGNNWSLEIGVNLEQNSKNPSTLFHEMGHNMGIRHTGSFGVMASDANGTSVWPSYFDDTMGQAGLGINKDIQGGKGIGNSIYMGQPVGPSVIGSGTGNTFQTGDEPEGFKNGEVQKK